jgi:hypothetical protein
LEAVYEAAMHDWRSVDQFLDARVRVDVLGALRER